MKSLVRSLPFYPIALCVALTLTLPAQEPAATPKSDPAVVDTPAPRPDEPAARAEPPAAPAVERPESPADSERKAGPGPGRKGRRVLSGPRGSRNGGEFPFGDHVIGKGNHAPVAVSVFGSTTVDGEVASDAVAVMGHTTIGPDAVVHGAAVSVLGGLVTSGDVKDDAVSVLGHSNIDGHVGGDAVCVLGDLTLGPKADIGGDVVVVLGRLNKHADAVIHGNEVKVPMIGAFKNIDWLTIWVRRCLLLGRPLAFGAGLGWAWGVAFAFLTFYLVLALLFGRGIDRCVETLETRPGSSILASLLTVLLAPIAIILLAVTVVGAILIPFLGAGLFFANLFGKAVMLAWIGRRLLRLGSERTVHPFVAVLIGGLVVMLLYTIWGSFLLYKLLSWIGLGVAVYTIALALKREKRAPAVAAAGEPPGAMPPVMPVAPVASMTAPVPTVSSGPSMSSGFVGGSLPPEAPMMPATPEFPSAPPLPPVPPTPPPVGSTPPPAFTPPPSPPPLVLPATPHRVPLVMSAATLPRAGLGIRLAAMAVDILLLALVVGFAAGIVPRALRFNPMPHGLLLGLAIYAAAMWKHKSTTIGGIICGLKVVRLDGRELDWTTSIVRAISCFLSLCAAGLGFIWVAFDDEKQSWHDKIAGTTVVRVPKGVSLL